MTLDQVQKRVAAIERVSGDNEDAHVEEDHLYVDVLRAIGEGTCSANTARLLAREALRAREIDFTRWYA